MSRFIATRWIIALELQDADRSWIIQRVTARLLSRLRCKGLPLCVYAHSTFLTPHHKPHLLSAEGSCVGKADNAYPTAEYDRPGTGRSFWHRMDWGMGFAGLLNALAQWSNWLKYPAYSPDKMQNQQNASISTGGWYQDGRKCVVVQRTKRFSMCTTK